MMCPLDDVSAGSRFRQLTHLILGDVSGHIIENPLLSEADFTKSKMLRVEQFKA